MLNRAYATALRSFRTCGGRANVALGLNCAGYKCRPPSRGRCLLSACRWEVTGREREGPLPTTHSACRNAERDRCPVIMSKSTGARLRRSTRRVLPALSANAGSFRNRGTRWRMSRARDHEGLGLALSGDARVLAERGALPGSPLHPSVAPSPTPLRPSQSGLD